MRKLKERTEDEHGGKKARNSREALQKVSRLATDTRSGRHGIGWKPKWMRWTEGRYGYDGGMKGQGKANRRLDTRESSEKTTGYGPQLISESATGGGRTHAAENIIDGS